MLRVPQSQKQVRSQNFPNQSFNVQTSKESFGYTGNSLSNVANAINDVGQAFEREKQKANNIEFANYERQMVEAKDRALYDDENGFYKFKGKRPGELQDQFAHDYELKTEELLKDVKDPALKERLIEKKKDLALQLSGQMRKHTFSEIQTYTAESTKANIEAAANSAIMNYKEPGAIAKGIEKQNALIDMYAETAGLSPEDVSNRKLNASSMLHSKAIKRFINDGDDKLAKEYYAQNKNTINGDDQASLEKLLEAGSIRGESQRLTDGILSQRLPMEQALKEARGIEDAKIRDEVVSRVKSRYVEAKQVEQYQNEELFQSAALTIEKTKSLDAIPVEQLDKLSFNQRKTLRDYLSKVKSGEPIKTDFNNYYKLEQMAAMEPKLFVQKNLWEDRAKLSDSDFKKFSSMQAHLRGSKKSSDAQKLLDGIESKNSIINNQLNEMEIAYGSKASKEDNEKANLFRKRVDEVVTAKQESLGRKVTNLELRDIVDQLRVEVVVDRGIFWDSKKRLFEVTPEDQSEFDFEDIPAESRSKIMEAYKRKGISNPTDQMILNTYISRLNKVAKR